MTRSLLTYWSLNNQAMFEKNWRRALDVSELVDGLYCIYLLLGVAKNG